MPELDPRTEERLDNMYATVGMGFTSKTTIYTGMVAEDYNHRFITKCRHRHQKFATAKACGEKLLAEYRRAVREGEREIVPDTDEGI